eukprot:COSAG02_NODE_6340_length_3640_cov_1.447614_1_plen_42_part_10
MRGSQSTDYNTPSQGEPFLLALLQGYRAPFGTLAGAIGSGQG